MLIWMLPEGPCQAPAMPLSAAGAAPAIVRVRASWPSGNFHVQVSPVSSKGTLKDSPLPAKVMTFASSDQRDGLSPTTADPSALMRTFPVGPCQSPTIAGVEAGVGAAMAFSRTWV